MSQLLVLAFYVFDAGFQDCVQALLDNLNGVIEDLSHRRAKQIDDASAMRTLSSSRFNMFGAKYVLPS